MINDRQRLDEAIDFAREVMGKEMEALEEVEQLKAKDTTLSGNPAKRFVWTISATQLQVEHGGEIMCLTSSWSTVERTFSQMMQIAGRGREYTIVPTVESGE